MVGRLLESHLVSLRRRIEVCALLDTHGTSRRKRPLHLDVRMSWGRTIKHWELACAVCQCERVPKRDLLHTFLPNHWCKHGLAAHRTSIGWWEGALAEMIRNSLQVDS